MRSDLLFGVQFSQSEEDKWMVLTSFEINKRQQELLNIANDPLIKEYGFSWARSLLSESGCQHYYLPATFLDVAREIRVKEPFDLGWLKQVSDGKRQLNFGQNLLRYDKEGDYIKAVAIRPDRQQPGSYDYSFFVFDLKNGRTSNEDFKDDYDALGKYGKEIFDYERQSKLLLYQLIAYMELGDIKEVKIGPGAKHGTKKAPDNLMNKEKFPIIIVNSNWNKRLIRDDSIEVRPHWRLQACGPNFSQRKLILIDGHQRSGMVIEPRRRIDPNNSANRKLGL